ncbi:3-methyladenine DNA glycosylase [Leucobacter sp. wl10]|nr:3-methyladenine DNA glycosylase [Leucobacter sp. wl10]
MPPETWRAREAAHRHRADALTAAHRERRRRRERHPVEDFLWTYYSVTPGELRRWHPGAGAVLEGAARDRDGWKYYAPTASPGSSAGAAGEAATVDLAAFFAKRGGTVDYVERLLSATLGRAARFGCFGLHEWAMVYRMTPEQLRHASLPLRIGHEATDRVVESHPIACTHFDAFRFFTPQAAPLNAVRPSRESQPDLEQAGCLHAGMDVYKWAAKLGPIVPGELLLDAFELARDIREVDMRASPYDVTGFTGASGAPLHPIPIETAAGKRQYARLQRGFADRGNALRERLLEAVSTARASRPPRPPA